jgi:hypothetical protein
MIRRQLCRDVDAKRSCRHRASGKTNRRNPRQTLILLHLGSAGSFHLRIGMELAPGKLQTALRCLIVSVINRMMNFMTKGTAMSEMAMKIPAEKLVVI